MLYALIMAGGAGTRFWPASRADFPKQLLPLVGQRSMLQQTCDRLAGLVPPERIIVLTAARLVEAVAAQLPHLPRAAIIGEPCKRDTAPCVGLAAHLVSLNDPDATILVTPADHFIHPVALFHQAIAAGQNLIDEDAQRIVTFGVRPTYPAEVFGYIERGDLVSAADALPAYRVRQFREKPNRQTAQEYLERGTFYWNSGIFLWRAATILSAIEQHEPQMSSGLAAIGRAIGSPAFAETLAREFAGLPAKSIDYAVMERYDNVMVIETPFSWDDVGNWTAVERFADQDSSGNTVVGRHLGIDTERSIVRTTDGHLVVTVGVEDLIVVHTDDATLVARRDSEGRLGEIVKQLDSRGWREYL